MEVEVPPPTCRICFETRAESGTRLISPCQCKGTQRWICVGCFRSCRLHSDAPNRCGVCLCPYTERHVEMVTPTLEEAEADVRAAQAIFHEACHNLERERENYARAVRRLGDARQRRYQRATSSAPVPNRDLLADVTTLDVLQVIISDVNIIRVAREVVSMGVLGGMLYAGFCFVRGAAALTV